MKYAIFGDIHANLEALQAVLAKARELGAEKFICIGDIVGYNANPGECLEIVRELNCECVVKGNHDEQASANTQLIGFNPQAARAIEWTRERLTEEQKEYLRGLHFKDRVGMKITVVHATLDMPHMWGYIFDKYSAEGCMEYQLSQICFFGHTHVPLAFDRYRSNVDGGRYDVVRITPNHKYLINVGSTGQPRDGDPRAAFALYSQEDKIVELHRVEYDIETTQKKILAAGLPTRLADRLKSGR